MTAICAPTQAALPLAHHRHEAASGVFPAKHPIVLQQPARFACRATLPWAGRAPHNPGRAEFPAYNSARAAARACS